MEVIDALEEARRQHGLPTIIRVDQGSQFTSKELDLWAYANGITLDFSRPGKPTDNAYVESFNATVRLECLGRHWFLDLDDACEKVEEWRAEYNGRWGADPTARTRAVLRLQARPDGEIVWLTCESARFHFTGLQEPRRADSTISRPRRRVWARRHRTDVRRLRSRIGQTWIG
jgi:Integrase core domain